MDKKTKNYGNKWNNYGTHMNKLYGQKMDKLWKQKTETTMGNTMETTEENMDTTMANIWKQLWKNNGQNVETY